MKVILFYDFLSEYGGVERVMANHTKWLIEAGHEVTLLFSHVDQKTAEYFHKGCKAEEISTLKIGETGKLFSSLLGFNNLKSHSADLVISYSFPSLYLARKMKCKQAFYYLPMEFIYFPLKKRWLWANDMKRKVAFFLSLFVGPVLKYLDKRWIKNKLVIANSEYTQREITERYGVDSIISYPPLSEIFKPVVSSQPTKPFILTAGRIIPDKKTDWLIEAFAKLEDKKLQFLIAGKVEDKHKVELMALAQRLGVESRIKFLGLVDHKKLAKLYSTCKCFVFASPEEAFGLGPVEAAACGSPIVAWNDNAGPNEYVIPALNGYLAKPYDLDDFAKKIKDAMELRDKNKIISSVNKFREKKQSSLLLNHLQTH